ncbi:MAG: hypothetical protein Ct9H300mP8_12160 [Gammaproteobacteria bacterium]|nr:MAG: hypothetical protein Ct9H300mP8_12160 [Gammaproteobacteria bacterium]
MPRDYRIRPWSRAHRPPVHAGVARGNVGEFGPLQLLYLRPAGQHRGPRFAYFRVDGFLFALTDDLQVNVVVYPFHTDAVT